MKNMPDNVHRQKYLFDSPEKVAEYQGEKIKYYQSLVEQNPYEDHFKQKLKKMQNSKTASISINFQFE